MGGVLWGVGWWGLCEGWPWGIECLAGTRGGGVGKAGLLGERCSFGVVSPLGNLLMDIVVLKMSLRLENRS